MAHNIYTFMKRKTSVEAPDPENNQKDASQPEGGAAP